MFGAKGMVQVKNVNPDNTGEVMTYMTHSTEILGTVFYTPSGTSEVPMFYSFPSRHSDGYKQELDHFLDVLQEGAEMSVTGRMTSAVSKIADACEESARTGLAVSLTWRQEELSSGYHFSG